MKSDVAELMVLAYNSVVTVAPNVSWDHGIRKVCLEVCLFCLQLFLIMAVVYILVGILKDPVLLFLCNNNAVLQVLKVTFPVILVSDGFCVT